MQRLHVKKEKLCPEDFRFVLRYIQVCFFKQLLKYSDKFLRKKAKSLILGTMKRDKNIFEYNTLRKPYIRGSAVVFLTYSKSLVEDLPATLGTKHKRHLPLTSSRGLLHYNFSFKHKSFIVTGHQLNHKNIFPKALKFFALNQKCYEPHNILPICMLHEENASMK